MLNSRFTGAPLRLVDSITELTSSDVGCVAVSGSHEGLSSAKYAIAAKPLLSVFNDAGVGKASAGIAGLAELEANQLVACAVSHMSACIGQAISTYEAGTVTHANPCALALGVVIGQSLRSLLQR